MHIGIDLDNTIVDYGNIFAKKASIKGLIGSNINLSKDEVKKK